MIVERGGKYRSVRTEDEEVDLFLRDYRGMAAQERAAVQDILGWDGEGEDPFTTLYKTEYDGRVASPEEFLTDPALAGAIGRDMWPKLREDFIEFQNGGYFECYMTGSIGYGKCVDGSTEVWDLTTGRRRADEVGHLVVPAKTADGAIEPYPATAFASGVKACSRVSLSCGRKVTLSADHGVFTGRGWVDAGDLVPGDLVAVAGTLPEPEDPATYPDGHVALAALLLADGGTTGAAVTFTNADKGLCGEFVALATALGAGALPTSAQNGGKATTWQAKGLLPFTRGLGIQGRKAVDKRVPARFWSLSRADVGLFLNWFYACDGHVNLHAKTVEVTLASEGLIDDLAFMLTRIGVLGRKQARMVKLEGKEFPAWRLTVSGAHDLCEFFAATGPIKSKEVASEELATAARSMLGKSNTNVDVVPVRWADVREIAAECGRRARDFGLCERSYMGRRRFQRLVREWGYKGRLSWLAAADLRWSRVESVEDGGLRRVYDLNVPGPANFVGGGIVLHNTYMVGVSMAYDLYKLGMMRSPQAAYGLSGGSQIVLFAFSTTISQAGLGLGQEFMAMMDRIPWFKNKFPRKGSGFMMRFPKNILFSVGTEGANRILGLNAIGGAIDETDFHGSSSGASSAPSRSGDEKTRAARLYGSVLRRIQSRFQRKGRIPSHMYLMSSKTTRRSFMVEQLRAKKNDPSVFVRDYAAYEVKPPEFYMDQTFRVFIGGPNMEPRILKGDDESLLPPEYRDMVVEVPMDYHGNFVTDIEGSLQEIAGVATNAGGKFFRLPERVIDSFEGDRPHPFTVEAWVCGGQGDFDWPMLAKGQSKILRGGIVEKEYTLKISPDAPRFAHIDPSSTDLPSGLAVAHIPRYVEVVRRSRDGEETKDLAPLIQVDFLLQILPPPGGEIDMGEIRSLLYEMNGHGFNVTRCTSDSYQSAETGIRLKEKGIEHEVVSTDKNRKAYDTLKTVIYEGRLVGYPFPQVVKELLGLEVDPKRDRVVRPSRFDDGTRGTKDVADALACVVYELETKRPSPMALPPPRRAMKGKAHDFGWVTGGSIPTSMMEE